MERYLYTFKDEKDINKKDILDYIVDLEGKTTSLEIETDFKGKARVLDYNVEFEPTDKRYWVNVLVGVKGTMYLDDEKYESVSGKEWYYIGFDKDYTDIGEIDFCDLFKNNTQQLLLDFCEDIISLLDNVIDNITTNDTRFFKIDITRADLDKYNRLLSLDLEEIASYYDLEKMEDLGAKTDDYIWLYSIDLVDDYVLTIDLASGTSNYYDNIVIWKRVGDEFVENKVLECEYHLGDDFELTLENGKKCYIKWNIED